jgi:hypothetical protein
MGAGLDIGLSTLEEGTQSFVVDELVAVSFCLRYSLPSEGWEDLAENCTLEKEGFLFLASLKREIASPQDGTCCVQSRVTYRFTVAS